MTADRHIVQLDDTDMILVRYHSLVAYRFRRAPTKEMVARVTPSFYACFDAIGSKVLLCSVIRAELGVPDAAAREALEQVLRGFDQRCAGVVNVVDGTGFGSAALRAVITGLSLVVRPSYPVKTVASSAEAARLLAQWWPADAPATTQADLARVIDAAIE